MGNTTIAFTFVMLVNVFLFLTQASIIELNPDSNKFFNYSGSLIGEFDSGSYTLDTSGDTIKDSLPGTSGNVNTDTNEFTDLFNSVKEWFLDSTGLNYLIAILGAPYNLLKIMGLPLAITFALGTLWYGITLFLLISFFWGRE